MDTAATALVDTRQIGEATVSVISEGILTWAPEVLAPEAAWRKAMPEANAAGELALGLNVALIRLGSATIVVDPGYDDPSAGPAPRVVRSAGLQAGLDALGLRPGDVTHVLITHAHGDHFGGVTVGRGGAREPRFPNARYLIGRADWQGNPMRDQPDSPPTRHFGALEQLGLLDLVDGDREVAPGVTMLHAPGESPGHSVIRVESNGRRFYYLGDLFHHPCEVEHLDWVSPGRDCAKARASRERIIAEAVPSEATLAFTHGRFPGWGRIIRRGDRYAWEWA